MTGPDNLTYAYDGLGRRTSVTKNGQTTTTLYDGWNPIQLRQGTTVIENRLTGPSLDETYGPTRGGITESYLTDALGTTVELRDSLYGQTTQYTYEPYGRTTHSASSTNIAKYTGREQDIADLYYYRNRYYKPSLGRFISEDPIGLAGGSNVFTYVSGNPLRYIDPYGLAWWDKLHGLPKAFWHWAHKEGMDIRDLTKEEARALHKEWENAGKPKPDSKGKHRDRERGSADPDLFKWLIPWWLTPGEVGCAPGEQCEGDTPDPCE